MNKLALFALSSLILPSSLAINCEHYDVSSIEKLSIKEQKEVYDIVAEFLIHYGVNFINPDVTFNKKDLLQRLKNFDFGDDRAEILLCAMLDEGKSFGRWKCHGCELIMAAAKIFAGNDGAKVMLFCV